MLEYLTPGDLVAALGGLRSRLKRDGTFVLFMTRRNWLTRPMIGRWWQSNVYDAHELERFLRTAGFEHVAFRRFHLRARYMALWGHVVEARG